MPMKKILYFIWGQPSQDDKKKAEAAGAMLRDASAWNPNDYTERCDEVMGDPAIIPEPYKVFIKTVGEVKDNAPTTDRPLDGMTVVELREYAKKEGYQIPASVTAKADLIAHLRAQIEAKAKAKQGTPSYMEENTSMDSDKASVQASKQSPSPDPSPEQPRL